MSNLSKKIKYDKVVTIKAKTLAEAKTIAKQIHPGYFVWGTKSEYRNKKSVLLRGKITKYKLFLIKRKKYVRKIK